MPDTLERLLRPGSVDDVIRHREQWLLQHGGSLTSALLDSEQAAERVGTVGT